MLTLRLATYCTLLILTACADTQPKPNMVPASEIPAYAVAYPDRLTAETEQLVADKQHATEQSEKLSARASDLKPGADPAVMIVVVRQSDEAGRTAAFADENRAARDLRAFWKEERGPITARANGAAQKQLTEGNCGSCNQLDLSPSLGYAVGAGIDKQLEKRLRASNEAHRTIDAHEDRIGTANVPAAQKLADDIALTSYQVNVELPMARDRVTRSGAKNVSSSSRRAARRCLPPSPMRRPRARTWTPTSKRCASATRRPWRRSRRTSRPNKLRSNRSAALPESWSGCSFGAAVADRGVVP